MEVFKILPENTKRFRLFFVLLFATTIAMITVAGITQNGLFLGMAFIILLVTVWLFYSRKRLLGQSVELDSSKMIYNMSAGERVELAFSDITFAGYFKKNLDSEKFGFKDGLYIYAEDIDRYYLIGSDFERLETLYGLIQKHCYQNRVVWSDIKRVDKHTLVCGIKELLERHSTGKILVP